MSFDWIHAGPALLAAFFASLVEFVEALTVVLAVGSVRGWQGALGGSLAALVLLLAIITLAGSALTRMPLAALQIPVGALLLLFGLRWLRKAVLRAAGVIPLHDEQAAFTEEVALARALSGGGGWDRVALGTAFQITLLEGIEVVFIVIAIGAGGPGLLGPASLGALAALVAVVILGVALHRPLARVPENSLKFAVGVLLVAFGSFWFGQGLGIEWPGADGSILLLAAGYLAVATVAVQLSRARLVRLAARPSGR